MSIFDEQPGEPPTAPEPEPTTQAFPEPATEPIAAEAAAPRRSGWHPVNTGHLVMGVAFVGLVGVWALVASETVKIADTGWILSLPWLAAGAAGLVATVLRGRRHPDDPDPGGYDYDNHYDHHGYGTRVQGWQ